MGSVPPKGAGKYLVHDSDDQVDDVIIELELRALNAELRALEHELFREQARGIRDASRRLVRK